MKLSTDDTRQMACILRHRLLNTAAGLKSASTLLCNDLDDRLEPREREYFALILKECDRVTEIGERVSVCFNTLPESIYTSLEQALSIAAEHIQEKLPMADVEYSIGEVDLKQEVCARTLQTIFYESVENAYELSHKPVHIAVSGEDSENLRIRISNEGEPMTAETMKKAFRPFYTTQSRHLGLGLSIARRMAKEQGGSARVLSDSEGNALEFTMKVFDGKGKGSS